MASPAADPVPLWAGDLLLDWPYGALGLAALLLGLWTRPRGEIPGGANASRSPRWRDPGWLLPMVWPMYLLHQVEEHGIDLTGQRYAFLGSLCDSLGYTATTLCPANPAFLFAVNVVGCQLAFALAWIYRRRRPLVAACVWGIPVVNAVIHLQAALVSGTYNPGLFTATLLFLPLSAYVLWVSIRAQVIRAVDLGRILGTGLVAHGVLLASLLLRGQQLIPESVFLSLNGLIGVLPLPFGCLGVRRLPVQSSQAVPVRLH